MRRDSGLHCWTPRPPLRRKLCVKAIYSRQPPAAREKVACVALGTLLLGVVLGFALSDHRGHGCRKQSELERLLARSSTAEAVLVADQEWLHRLSSTAGGAWSELCGHGHGVGKRDGFYKYLNERVKTYLKAMFGFARCVT